MNNQIIENVNMEELFLQVKRMVWRFFFLNFFITIFFPGSTVNSEWYLYPYLFGKESQLHPRVRKRKNMNKL